MGHRRKTSLLPEGFYTALRNALIAGGFQHTLQKVHYVRVIYLSISRCRMAAVRRRWPRRRRHLGDRH